MKQQKSGDTFGIDHENQFKCSDPAHKSFEKVLQTGQPNVAPGGRNHNVNVFRHSDFKSGIAS